MSIQFERAEVASLKKQVIEGMRAAIVDGSFPPGTKLVERELCSVFDVSRSLIREVLQQLEAESLITVVPHRGPMVAEISLEEARSIYAVRQALEALAGAGCAEHATERDIEALEASLARVAECGDGGDEQALLRAKNDFYAVLLKACGNTIVRDMLTGLNNRINALRRLSMSRPGRVPETVRELQAVIEAIRDRDADRAARLCSAHVARAAALALEAMAEAREAQADEGLEKTAPEKVARAKSAQAKGARSKDARAKDALVNEAQTKEAAPAGGPVLRRHAR